MNTEQIESKVQEYQDKEAENHRKVMEKMESYKEKYMLEVTGAPFGWVLKVHYFMSKIAELELRIEALENSKLPILNEKTIVRNHHQLTPRICDGCGYNFNQCVCHK